MSSFILLMYSFYYSKNLDSFDYSLWTSAYFSQGIYFIWMYFSQFSFVTTISLKSSPQNFYGYHHEPLDRYSVSICTMKTVLFNVFFIVSFPISSTPDFLWATRRVFLEKQRTLPVHLVHAPSFLLVQFSSFSYFMFFVVFVCFLCQVFVPGLHSFDFR